MKQHLRACACLVSVLCGPGAASAQFDPAQVPKVDMPPTGTLPNLTVAVPPVTQNDLMKRAGEQWVTYHGDYSGQRYAYVDQITRKNVADLRRAWSSETNPPQHPAGRRGPPAFQNVKLPPVGPGRTSSSSSLDGLGGVRSSPLYQAGLLFYTIGQNAFAIDARTGKQVWHYIGNSTGGISNRGLGISGDTLFMMANGGLTAIDAKTGVEKWRKHLAGGSVVPYAPIIVRDHVYINSGSSRGTTRAWLESRNVRTGEREWIWYSVPNPGERGAETWPSVTTMVKGGGSPWQPLTYDPELNLLFFGTGNPDPIKDGADRPGDNLYTSTIVALDADSGQLKWHFQMVPHDDHDYDGTQTTVLFSKRVAGKERKLLAQVSRSGFLFVLDRVTGENLVSQKIFPEVNWTDHNRPNGTPEPTLAKSPQAGGVLLFPSSEGVTNWPSPSYSPQTGLIYVNTVKSRGVFYPKGREYIIGSFRNSLRALDPLTGKVAWVHEYLEPYGINARYPGVLSTAGGVIFTGDVSGNFVAFDAMSGEILWHDELPSYSVSNAPISYVLDGKQHIVVGSGDQLFAYTLP